TSLWRLERQGERLSEQPAAVNVMCPAIVLGPPIAQERTVKLLFFDDFKLGVLKGDAVIDVSETVRNIPHTGPHDLISGLIARFADYKERVQEAVDRGRGVPIGQVRIRPPLPKPSNIVCMAVNYMEDGPR